MTLITCITFTTATLPFALTYTNMLVIDELIKVASQNAPDLAYIITYTFITLSVGYTIDMLWRWGEYVQRRLRFLLLREFGYLLHTKTVSLDLEHFERPMGIALLNRIDEQIRWTPANYIQTLIQIFFSMVQMGAAIVMILTINPFYILATTLTLIPSLIVSLRASEDSYGIWSYKAEVRNKYLNTTRYLKDPDMIKEIKVLGIATKLIHILKSTYEEFEHFQLKVQTRLAKSKVFSQTVEYSGWIYVYIDILRLVVSKNATVGNFILVRSVLTEYSNTTKLLFESISLAFESGLWMKDVYKLLDTPTTLSDVPNAYILPTHSIPAIEFRHVSFRYPGTEVYIFKDLSFTIKPGEDIAIVGENGAGKSTLVKLLCRFYDVTSGKILIDGRDLKSIDLKSWHGQLGTLFQDFNKYAYTVEENLDLSMNEDAGQHLTGKARSDAFMTALSKASADFVREYPRGLQTVLARSHKHGVDPSGGQWQRIALARAFYRDANILILDEPTSAIDAKGEYEIFEQIRAHQKNKTTIIISHRFSTVRNAQRILVIQKGKIIESGSHDALMQIEGGLYQSLFAKQAEGYQ